MVELYRESRFLLMKLVSINVRGLGRSIKRRELKNFVRRENLDMLCIQETKLETITREVCNSIWDDSNFRWNHIPSVGRSGGILCIWRNSSFNVHQVFVGNNFIGLKGCWGIDFECVIVSVYAP